MTMESSNKSTTERMRTVLQAMERGIDAARRRRVNAPEPTGFTPPQTPTSAPAVVSSVAAPISASFTQNQSAVSHSPILSANSLAGLNGSPSNNLNPNGTPKLKAKPKRPSPFVDLNPPAYRSQAG